MGEVISKNKYLDFNGLEKYDKLIKSYIALANKSLANASDVSALQIDVAALKEIDHDAYISADKELETSIKEYINGKVNLKQDVIEDLDVIRSGAAKGATALQAIPDEYVTETELEGKGYSTEGYVDAKVAALVDGAPETLNTLDELAAALKDNADIVDVLTNSIGTKQDTISDLDTIRANAAKGATALQEVPAEYVTETELEGKGYLTESDLVFATNDDVDGLFA